MSAVAGNFSMGVLGRKIAFSTLVQYAGKGLQLVLAAISLKLISNFLSQGGYGVYASITEYALFFSTIANLGIFGNVVRMMAEKPTDSSIFMNSLILRMATAVLFFVTGIVVSVFSGMNSIFVLGTTLFLGSLFFDYVTSVCDGMLQANYEMGRANFALVLGKIINTCAIFFLTRTFQGDIDVMGMFCVLGIVMSGSFVTASLSLFFVSRKIRLKFEWNSSLMLKILEVSIPFGVINIVNNLYFRFLPDYLSRAALDDVHFASFNVYFRIAQVLSLASTFLMFSALPALTDAIKEGHKEKARKLYKIMRKILFGGGMALVTLGSLLGPTVIALLTHQKYNLPEFWFVLPLMLVLAAVSYGYDLVLLTLFGSGEDVWFLKREFLALAVAAVFFLGSYGAGDMSTKMALILLGAISGELTMVIAGSKKIKEFFTRAL